MQFNSGSRPLVRIGAAAVAVVTPLALAVTPAQAETDGNITVRVSDSTPASGEQFIARGKFTIEGKPAADHLVKVQTLRDGEWEQISGAKVWTNDDGKYRVRLILSMTGKRVMRVVGVGQGDESNERERFVVRVH